MSVLGTIDFLAEGYLLVLLTTMYAFLSCIWRWRAWDCHDYPGAVERRFTLQSLEREV